jgi:hypothetical protein
LPRGARGWDGGPGGGALPTAFRAAAAVVEHLEHAIRRDWDRVNEDVPLLSEDVGSAQFSGRDPALSKEAFLLRWGLQGRPWGPRGRPARPPWAEGLAAGECALRRAWRGGRAWRGAAWGSAPGHGGLDGAAPLRLLYGAAWAPAWGCMPGTAGADERGALRRRRCPPATEGCEGCRSRQRRGRRGEGRRGGLGCLFLCLAVCGWLVEWAGRRGWWCVAWRWRAQRGGLCVV